MTAPAKYTLPRVLELVQYHAAKLGTAGQAVHATEGKDPEVLAILGARALKAAEELWAIDEDVGFNAGGCAELFDVWYGDDAHDAVGHARNVLPLVVLAVEGCGNFTAEQQVAGLEPWRWCQEQTERIAEDLIKWVMAREVVREVSS